MEDDLDANYELVSDIDASNTAQFNDGRGFDPVGASSFNESTPPPFTGSLDGTNHTITGLTIDRPGENAVGLFGQTADGALIANLSVRNLTVTGEFQVGGLVGFNDGGTIQNATATGSVTGETQVGGLVGKNSGTITNASASGNVAAEGSVGGLVGRNRGQIETSSATGDVTSQTGAAGGLVGDTQQGTFITESFATGDVTVTNGRIAGGLVGAHLNGTITNSYARGDVDAENTVGGLVGSNVGETASIDTSYATGTVTAEGSLVGGFAGVNRGETSNSYWDITASEQSTSAGDAVGLQTTEMQGQAAQTNMSALAFGTNWRTVSGGYPELIALSDAEADAGETSVVGEYAGDDGDVSPSELLEAIGDFRAGELQPTDVLEVIQAFRE